MANYTTSADLLDDILFRAREPTDGTSDLNAQAIVHLNRAYQGIWGGGSELDPNIHEKWWWLRKDDQGVLTLNPVHDDGTISVTNNSTTITFSSAPSTSMAGRHFKVNDHADVFVISSHTAETVGGVLESVYTGATNTAASYRAMHLDYDLATDLLHIRAPIIAYQDGRQEIDIIDLENLTRRWPLNERSSGVPRDASMIGQKKIRFSHYGGTSSTDLIKLDYEYTKEPSDLADNSTEPLVPRQYRKILADWALAFVLEDKSDDKSDKAIILAQQGLKAMAKEHRRILMFGSQEFARVKPRQRDLEQNISPLRTESGSIIG
jgi:hypothetical protein